MRRPKKKPNPAARSLADRRYRQRKVKPRKGKGSYRRKPVAGE